MVKIGLDEETYGRILTHSVPTPRTRIGSGVKSGSARKKIRLLEKSKQTRFSVYNGDLRIIDFSFNSFVGSEPPKFRGSPNIFFIYFIMF